MLGGLKIGLKRSSEAVLKVENVIEPEVEVASKSILSIRIYKINNISIE